MRLYILKLKENKKNIYKKKSQHFVCGFSENNTRDLPAQTYTHTHTHNFLFKREHNIN